VCLYYGLRVCGQKCVIIIIHHHQFFVMNRSPENFYFFFFPTETLSMPEWFYAKTAEFELVQQFYHAAVSGNVINAVSPCADQP